MGKKLTSITGLVIIAVIVLAVNLIGHLLFGPVKIDMTEEKLFTLSKGSRNIVKSLDETVRGNLYYSKTAAADNAFLKLYATRVIQMLESYESVSDGRFSLEIVDPRPDTDEEMWADRYGLHSLPGPNGEPIYLGLVLRDESGHETTIPFFDPNQEATLEYEVSRAIINVSKTDKPTIGVVSSLGVMGSQPPPNPMMQQQQATRPWYLIRQLRASFDVEEIESDAADIPENIDLLLVIHPKDIAPSLEYAIDQYVLDGGRAVVFVDAFCHAEIEGMPNDMQMRMQADLSSTMPRLFEAWGIKTGGAETAEGGPMGMSSAKNVVADINLALSVNSPNGVQQMPVWLGLRDENRNKDEIVTSQLENINIFSAAGLEIVTNSEEIDVVPLLSTTSDANYVDGMMIKFGPDPEAIRKAFEPGSSSIMLAARLSGSFKTAFPDGRPTDEEGQFDPDPAQIKESTNPTSIIVVGDVDMLTDQFAVQLTQFFGQEIAQLQNDNLSLAYNAIENMSGSEDLISLRSRGRFQRPFTKVIEIERVAQAQYAEEEKRLNEKYQEANQRLSEMQRGDQERQILSEAYLREVEKLREERAKTQQQLREVRLRLREGVERLGLMLKIINIGLMPLLVVVIAIAIAVVRTTRKTQAEEDRATS